ncbi:MAG: histidine--tRNA ligase [Candidatus Roizmanbacteria bacterium]
MLDTIQTLKGFRDFIGQQAREKSWLIDKIKSTFQLFGFEPLETPTLEYDALLSGKYGDEADKLIYKFEDNGGRKVALRYDQTVPTARVVAQYRNEIIFPYKRYQIQPVWRAEKPQKGRFREFTQCDADIIGSFSPLADAEILAIYASVYINLGIKSIQIKLNDRPSLIQMIRDAGIPEETIKTVILTIDKLDKKSELEVIEELVEKGLEDSHARTLLAGFTTAKMPENLQKIVNLAVQLGIPEKTFVYSPALARGLDYYTGMIFEGIIPEYPVGSVGGGGRYDNLIKDLVGVDMPAVGFGIGFDRTLEASQQLGLIPLEINKSSVLVTIFSPELIPTSLSTVAELHKHAIRTELFSDFSKKLDQQLKYANAKNIPWVIIIGPDEQSHNKVQLKNMQTREQSIISIDEVIQKIQG